MLLVSKELGERAERPICAVENFLDRKGANLL